MKKAHIISHSHWDREWYLPYEKHHMLLVEFMDTLLDTIKENPQFKSFHLDGQTIMLEDYLQVRPEREGELKNAIKEERIYIGPWYMLQDEWLTSSESNVRNLQIGAMDCEKYGKRCEIGYFPDSFGNMGQAPQILKEAGIETAAFGRGVKPTGFNNEVEEGNPFASQYSEMYWEAPDKSRVLGILFANWYSNGIEIPTDKEEAKVYWKKKLSDASLYASTEELLFMNGCDHQPVQTDLTQAMETASDLFPDVTFIHSNFIDYVGELNKSLKKDLAVIYGELRSQNTNGWYTLAGTASSRIYLKQMNQRCEMLFAKIAEPLCTMAYACGAEYPHHLFLYGWKTLMQNHPHDSICGCSVDEVHREMVTRFEKAEQVALHIIDEAMNYFAKGIDVSCFHKISENAIPFFVANPAGYIKSGVIETEIPLDRFYFRDTDVLESIRLSKETIQKEYKVVTKDGKVLDSTVTLLPHSFGYDLPKDKFRQPYMERRVRVVFETEDIMPFSFQSFALVEASLVENKENVSLIQKDGTIENEYIKVKIEENGSLTVTEKKSGHTYHELGILEDCGDVGNEYLYGTLKKDEVITTKDAKPEIIIVEDKSYRTIVKAEYKMNIPKSADDMLLEEIADLVSYNVRAAGRSKEKIEMKVTVLYTIERREKAVKVKVTFNNQALDHRMRVLFPTNITTQLHYADSIFQVAERKTQPEKEWENPCNAAHQQAFVNVHNEDGGITIGNKGLNEYEILRDGKNTIALTIHRGIRELGDWGIFMTPEAQCLGEHTVEYAILVHDKNGLLDSYERAYDFQRDITVKEIRETSSLLPESYQFMEASGKEVIWSSLKVNADSGHMIGRWFNVTGEKSKLVIDSDFELYRTNLLEKQCFESYQKEIEVDAYKIVTIGMK